MTDLELADRIAKTHSSWDYLSCTHEERQQIIAALRRGPERQPSGEMVMVPREDLIRWASWFEEADSRIGPCWLGVKRDTSFKEAADEMRAHLGGTFKCPRCGVATPHQHNIDRKGNVMLSAAEADEAQARIAELEKDAARYRFLRENVRAHDRMVGYCIRAWTFDAPCDIVTLDAAIDAALKDRV